MLSRANKIPIAQMTREIGPNVLLPVVMSFVLTFTVLTRNRYNVHTKSEEYTTEPKRKLTKEVCVKQRVVWDCVTYLDKSALYLSNIYCRIQTLTDVHHNVNFQYLNHKHLKNTHTHVNISILTCISTAG